MSAPYREGCEACDQRRRDDEEAAKRPKRRAGISRRTTCSIIGAAILAWLVGYGFAWDAVEVHASGKFICASIACVVAWIATTISFCILLPEGHQKWGDRFFAEEESA